MNSMEAPNPLPVSNMIYGWNFVALFVVIIGNRYDVVLRGRSVAGF